MSRVARWWICVLGFALLAGCAETAEVATPAVDLGEQNATEQAPMAAPWPTTRPGSALVSQDGDVCDDPRLRGDWVPFIQGRLQGCGIDAPVRLRAVAGVALTRPVTLHCDTAIALADWLEQDAIPETIVAFGEDLAEITPYASYACRTRNSQPGARLSEHAQGRAVDIGAFKTTNGRVINVLSGWNGVEGDYLREISRKACGPFKTVLGPDADAFHRNHFHFDVAKRSSTYCR